MTRIKLPYPAAALIVLSMLSFGITSCVGPLTSASPTAQSITFTTPAAQTVGTPLTLSATASSGLAVSFASNTTSVCTVSGTTVTFLTSGMCSITASQTGNNTFAAATPVTDSFTVNAAAKTAQTITFATPAAQTVGMPLTLSATASSGLAVSFASNTTSVCTVSGTTATFLTSGMCSITASQAGNSTFAAATPVTDTFTVNAAALTAQTITFATPATQMVGTPLALSATASSGLAVSFASNTTSVCTVSGTTATFLIAGTCSITASQPGNGTFAAATPVTDTFTVNAAAKTAQTITFATPATQMVGTPLALSATASSGLAVSFVSNTTSVCTVSGTTATFLIAGTCSITASQAGNSTFAAATPVTDTFTVNAAAKTAQTITFTTPATQTVGTPLVLSATASSGLAVSFMSNTTSVCTVSGTTATFLISGTCSITASQAGNSTFAAATPVTDTFTVNAAALMAQTITFATPATQTVGVDLPLSATASSGLAVSFVSNTTNVCTVSGTTATFLIAGTCTITASQAGNGTYAAAAPVTDSFMVNAATTGGGLPPLPAMSNVQAQISGNTVNITFDPVDGAKDYRAYIMPDNTDIVTSGGNLVGVKNAIYRCAGLRAVPPVQPAKDSIDATNTFGQGSGNDSFTQTHVAPYAIEFGPSYTRTTADDTLGYVFTSSQPNTAPVYEVGDPAAFSDHYGDGIRLKQTREKMYLQDFTAYQAKVAAGWRDDGIVFYAPTNASACGGSALKPVDEIETTDTGYNLLYRWYYSSTAEVAAWGTVNFATTPQNTPFSVCPSQVANSQPLMRVNYTFPTNQNAHDELAVGQSRYDLARCQGTTTGSCASVASRALWSIRYSGITAPTQLVVEALDSGCPYPGGLWGTDSEPSSHDPIIPTPPYPTPVDNFTDPIFTLAQIQQASPGGIGEAYLNGQFDLVPNTLGETTGSPFVTNGTPHPIARAVLNVAPQARPAMDFSSNFENSETFTEVFTNIDGTQAPDCGLIEAFPPNGDIQAVFPSFEAVGCQDSYQLTSPTYDVLVFGGESPETVGMSQGEFITAGGGAVWTAPLHPPAATISSTDNTKFLHAALEVNGYSDDRRYPQIMISDHWEGTPGNTTPPVQDVPPTFMTTQWYLLDAPANDPSGNPFPDGDEQNTLFLTAIYSTGPNMLIELCSNRGWAVNEHCPYFILERFGNSLVPNPFSSTPPEIHPETSNAFPDINDVMQEDTAVRWDLYVSKHKIYFYANSKAYGCVDTTTVAGITPGDNTPHIPTGSVNVSFGDRLYHPEAETGELCATNSFLCRHSNFETSRRYDYFGYSSDQSVTLNSSGQFNAGSDGSTASWDESVIPCNSVIFDNVQDGGTLNPEQ